MGMARQTRDEQTQLEKVLLQTEQGTTAEIFLHGAHVTSFKPAGGEEVIFVSKQAVFKPPKAIRGGIPVCWPQFNDMGPGQAHGFARNSVFSVVALKGSSVIMELLPDAVSWSDEARDAFPHDFVLRCTVAISDDHNGSLTQVVEATNKGSEPMQTTNALHTYYRVADATKVSMEGLEGVAYFDNADARKRKEGSPTGPSIAGFTDRIYANTGSQVAICDPGLGRKVVIKASGFQDTVVWNPWKEKAAGMTDFGDDEYQGMLCVEPANAALYLEGKSIKVGTGDTWTAQQSIYVEAFS